APSDAVVTRLVERSSGNAFYLEELIRVAAEAQSAGRSIEEQLPATVIAMVQARLERLEPDARRVLRAASVFGQVFWAGSLAALLGGEQDRRRLDEWLSELVSREMISRRAEGKFAGESEFLFHHALVREAAYAMLTDGDRKLGHLIAGKWLEGAGESDAMTLAEHFERGGEHQKAIGWYRKAAEHALEGNDFEAVVARAERAVACGAQGEVLGGLRVLQAEAHRWRGDLVGAETCALDAMRLLPRCTPPWFSAVSDLALASGRRGKGEQVGALAQMLQELGHNRDVTGPHAMASARAATQLLLAGNKQEVAEALIAQLDRVPRAEQEKNPAVTARVAVARFYHAICGGDVGAGSEFAKTAIARFEAVGDLRNACVQRGDFAYTQVELGAYGPATDTLREVLELSERLGRLQYATLAAKQNLGIALARRGSLEEGRRIEEEALAEFQAKGDHRMAGGSRIHLAEIRLLAGDHDGAEKEALAAIETLSNVPAVKAHAMAMLASIDLARGRLADALNEARQANDFLEKGGVLDEGEGLVRLVYAEALWANERQVEGRAAIGTARRRLVERSLRIRDENLRKSFLERVPENARTLELALAWTPAPPPARSA
ncbi:MAG: serine/threonine-protein kinase PknK, partial [Polyangiales bacterium]